MDENPNIRSLYVLTTQNTISGKAWPRSQFEKIDVLACCLFYGSDEHKKQLRLLQEQAELERLRATGEMALPLELIWYIMDILSLQGLLRPRFLLLNRLIYFLGVPLLYRHPRLRGDNFYAFVDTISSSKKLGEHIRHLDLSHVNHSGKNAFVAKLLKRSRPFLESFTAPQTSFGLGPLMALRGCTHLVSLDLRLVSETLNLGELFASIRQLTNLTHLLFPRSSIEINDYKSVVWPPRLTYLRVSGGISDDFLMELEFPPLIRHMEFAHCPQVHHYGFQHMLLEFGRNLRLLRIQFPMPGLQSNSLDSVFELCPNLRVLEVLVDYLSAEFFDEQNLLALAGGRPLTTLYIDSSGMLGTTDKLDPIDMALAISEGRLPNLRHVRCTAKLGWDPLSEFVSFIASELEDRRGGLYIGY